MRKGDRVRGETEREVRERDNDNRRETVRKGEGQSEKRWRQQNERREGETRRGGDSERKEKRGR